MTIQPAAVQDVATTSVTVRLPNDLADQINAAVEALQAKMPIGTVTKTDLITEALRLGLPALAAQYELELDTDNENAAL